MNTYCAVKGRGLVDITDMMRSGYLVRHPNLTLSLSIDEMDREAIAARQAQAFTKCLHSNPIKLVTIEMHETHVYYIFCEWKADLVEALAFSKHHNSPWIYDIAKGRHFYNNEAKVQADSVR